MRTLLGLALLMGGGLSQKLQGPLSDDFQAWLKSKGYNVADFTRPGFQTDSLYWASYGGKLHPTDPTTNPVIFVHGNSDSALANPNALEKSFATGWDHSIKYFLEHGYQPSQLYATTWGPADAAKAADQIHACAYLMQLRKFFEAVLAYTGAARLDIISHSMGVTLSRRVVLGGSVTDSDGAVCDLGGPLTDKSRAGLEVDTFVGIAGGNHGLCACSGYSPYVSPTCNAQDGFDPGACSFIEQNCYMNACSQDSVVGVSKFLKTLNSQSTGYEGAHRYYIYSLGDDVITNGDNCYGHPTSRFPHATGGKTFDVYTHMESKDLTPATQLAMVAQHRT